MNIGFDASAILGQMSKNRGIGNYAFSQFAKMMELDRENKYFCFNLFEELSEEFQMKSTGFQEIYWYFGKNGALLKNKAVTEVFGGLVRKFLKENEIDLFYFTSPFDIQVIPYQKEWFLGINTVATVYDIIPYIFRKKYLPSEEAYQEYMEHAEIITWVDKCLVISDCVKKDMVKHLNFPQEKIEVIYGASDEAIFCEITITEDEKRILFQKFGIENRFLMCTGGDDERKNIAGLIEAYAMLPRELIERYQLAVVCKLSANSVERYSAMANELGISGRLVLTNFVTTEELVQLYNLAEVMVFPSQYEGFGLPVVEAWMCGTAVVTSNNSSLGEIGGDGAILVDPYSTKKIMQGMEAILTDPEKLRYMEEKGRERLTMFCWTEVAKKTIEILNELSILDDNMPPEEIPIHRIAFFTPLPPLKSGIADYSYDILCEISKYFDIDVYIDNGYTFDCSLPANVQVIHHKLFEKNADKYDEILYQIGNSEFHQYMFEYVQTYKGIVVLHDYNLIGILQAMYVYCKIPDLKKYKRYLDEDKVWDEEEQDLNHVAPDSDTLMQPENEINGFVTNYAKKIIVHSDYAKRKLLQKDIHRTVKKIPLYAKIEEITPKKREVNQPVVFASFGHVHETKRILPILEAFRQMLDDGSHVKLLLVGEVAESLEALFYEKLEELDLKPYVEITGYTALEDFIQNMNAADVCLNLRYPYNGETSASFMRLLERGKYTIVNNIGSFSEIPNQACVKLPSVETMSSKEEIRQIYKAMIDALNIEKRKRVEDNARMYAKEELDLRKIGRQYKEFIECNIENKLTEKIIHKISSEEVLRKGYTVDEVRKLAKTFSYVIGMK